MTKFLVMVLLVLGLVGPTLAREQQLVRTGFVRLLAFDPRDGQWHRARLFDSAAECHDATLDLESVLGRAAKVDSARFRKYFDCVPE
jgi:hypothetical protein